MNTIQELVKISRFISDNLNLLSVEELGRLIRQQSLLSSKVHEEVVSQGTTVHGKATLKNSVYQTTISEEDNLTENQEEVSRLLYNLVENFNHNQKEYNELLFDLVFGLMAAEETSDRDEWYRIRIMLLYKVMMDLGQCLFPNSYINKPIPAKLKAI
ncbi:hypothetical protein [Agriterribacter sp.]|uniref:hypothetical protein n=1 Tax=Agriterribacter sp. TaxID=2821509 RepID=UPI002D11594A|nr:hypothetical protein [Agriterribacter sp.]HRO45125.1 hypothetical protein [Agriterribacter sp.]HRQ15434.1 hypothetical protein [Agriterribacter sp.]